MTHLKKGQHYDRKTADTIAFMSAIKKHLQEDECNHSLRQIVEDGLS